jgi:putative ABC transport system permease protein
VLRRLASRPALSLLALAGVVLAVGLLTSSAFFSQAVDRVILSQELTALSQKTGRIPFSMRVYFLPSARVPVSLASAEELAGDVSDTLASEIGLPLLHLGIQVESGGLMLLPPSNDTRYAANKSFLNTINLVYIANVADHLAVVAGEPLGDYPPVDSNTLDVWMHADLAAEMGVAVGERFQVAVNLRQAPRQVVVRGLWRAQERSERFWFSNPDTTLRNAFLITRSDYIAFAEPMLAAKSGFVNWHIILDDQPINPAYAADYVDGFEKGMVVINQYLLGARLDVSPLDPLRAFVQRQATLTMVLLGFNVPAFLFLLYFLMLIALIIARWQQRETALLVSRGMGANTVLGLTLLEQLLLFVVGMPLGLALGMWLARRMGDTASFLVFDKRPPLPVSLQGLNYPLLAIALGVTLLARLLPTWGATRQSVVEQAREGGRPLRAPFWQRIYADVLLVAPTYYAYDQLAKQGTLALRAGEPADQLFQDPLLVLVPALFVLTAVLLAMRLFPWFMRLLDLLASRTPWLIWHLALRQLGRSSQGYINPLLLVAVSLGMGVYTRSLAASLDQWLADQVHYRVGADITFTPTPPLREGESEPPVDGAYIPPPYEFSRLPGVEAATRVGDYPMRVLASSGEKRGRLIALDRVEFSRVAWFRRDFARESLGGLMNALASAPESVLVTQQFLDDHRLQVGDEFNMRVNLSTIYQYVGAFRIAGVYYYFPTVQPDELTMIGNLEHLFTEGGTEFVHQIWLRMRSQTLGDELFAALKTMSLEPAFRRDVWAILHKEQGKMERVGIFGTLSVGFVAATLMAILALLVHSYASLQERLYQFGVMRAIGLKHVQVIGQVVVEYGVLSAYGALVGAAVGLITAQVFAPFFRIPDTAGAPPPPLIPLIEQDASLQLALLFATLMILAELLVLARGLGARLFDALRMGHQG